MQPDLAPVAAVGQLQALAKSSGYRGVTLFRPTGKWRAQISAGGKTTSLGDHETEESAARAFDRAAINKNGHEAKTNFVLSDYAAEMADLQAMSQTELVAMLRSKARKSSTQTSRLRGVSLLKQTGKWHAQINVGGKQVHLGFFNTEELAGRAYDRAAINKGARDGGKIITNYDMSDYGDELEILHRISQDDLVSALASERRKQTMEMLSEGLAGKAEEVFGRKFAPGRVGAPGAALLSELYAKAERAQPKPTPQAPLYENFGKRKDGAASPIGGGRVARRLTFNEARTSPAKRGAVEPLTPSPGGAKQARGTYEERVGGSPLATPPKRRRPAKDSGLAPRSPLFKQPRMRRERSSSPPPHPLAFEDADGMGNSGQTGVDEGGHQPLRTLQELLQLRQRQGGSVDFFDPYRDAMVNPRTSRQAAMAQRIMERQKVAEAQKAIEAHSHTNNAISSEDDASSTPLKLDLNLGDDSDFSDEGAHGSAPRRSGKHRRTRRAPARAAF